ncbi:MAG: TIGR00730 family Rossman fold protein [Candidatus Latescibacterota bacterium]|jgi:hypothetical protein
MPTKAYRNLEFLTGPRARILRILAEYLEPEARFEQEGIDEIVVFFGSARAGAPEQAAAELARARQTGATGTELTRLETAVKLSRYYQDARELARLLAEWSRQVGRGREAFVLCSGGGPGVMEAANRGAADAGCRSIGLNISLPHEQAPNPYITPELNLEFHYFFMRKLWFVHLACALVAFPGGFGTLDELAEVLTLIQTGRSRRMPVVIYGREFWREVLDLEALVRWGTISPEDLDLVGWADTPQEALSYLQEKLTPRFAPGKG